MPTVLLYGLGAIGGFYAFILSRNKDVELDVVARSNHDALQQHGLKIHSANHGEHVVRPRNGSCSFPSPIRSQLNITHKRIASPPADSLAVFKTPAEATSPYSYVVCAHKALKLDNVIPDALSPAIGPATTIVIIQNGVGNEDPFRARYPSNTIISCVTWVGAKQSSPGVIQHMKSENTELGLFSNASASPEDEQAKLDTFTQLLTSGGTPFTVESDIQSKRWEKVVWNWFVHSALHSPLIIRPHPFPSNKHSQRLEPPHNPHPPRHPLLAVLLHLCGSHDPHPNARSHFHSAGLRRHDARWTGGRTDG